MSVQFRNNVHVTGSGPATMVFVHGFGCDQTMWRHLAPAFAGRYRVVLYDLTGSGRSDWSAYDRTKYASLHGHVTDLLEVLDACAAGPTVVVGHSVGASIGLLAAVAAPRRFVAQVLVGPSPCYVNDGDYVGGFNPEDIAGLLDAMEANFLEWSRKMAPAIMGAPNQPDLGAELTRSFCRNDPAIAKHFARVTFQADIRADVARCTVPALILQCSDDLIVPREVGEWLHRHLAHSTLCVIDNVGHCPHVSAPTASSDAIETFLARALR
ncbi:alpha/beta fold hydrolase [Massilia rhizosphaerae]|uniref:alpha/beta fold hydrolase n=1 Tax=Massilia rhizosphaerae TaxID=2784389 RepID=UPI0018DC06DA|nr:alpha/beta hydrolase [Massilia rhizosphaerae]